MKKFLILLKIEAKLTLRCPESIFFSICMPMGIMILIGLIGGKRAAFDGAGYTFLQGAFGALITVGICATALMAIPLTISDYRDKKVLKHFFVTPVSPVLLLGVQAAINFMLSAVSAVFVSGVAAIVFGYRMQGSTMVFAAAWLLVLLAMYSIGLCIASFCPTVKTANVVCSIVYFPMLFLSGATIPYEIFPRPLQYAANILPLTQGIKLLKNCSLGIYSGHIVMQIVLLCVCTVICTVLSLKLFRWE